MQMETVTMDEETETFSIHKSLFRPMSEHDQKMMKIIMDKINNISVEISLANIHQIIEEIISNTDETENELSLRVFRYQQSLDKKLIFSKRMLHRVPGLKWPMSDKDWFNLISNLIYNNNDAIYAPIRCKNQREERMLQIMNALSTLNGYTVITDGAAVLQEWFINRWFLQKKLTPTAVNHHPHAFEEDSREPCVVCLEDCATRTPCNHPLCDHCKAKLRNLKCPLCRQSLLEEMDYFLQRLHYDRSQIIDGIHSYSVMEDRLARYKNFSTHDYNFFLTHRGFIMEKTFSFPTSSTRENGDHGFLEANIQYFL